MRSDEVMHLVRITWWKWPDGPVSDANVGRIEKTALVFVFIYQI